jgi:glutathione S-transferase
LATSGAFGFALDRFTIADIAFGSSVKRRLEFPVERPLYSEFVSWQAAINARPAVAVVIGTKPSALSLAA